jgi:YVTN family beta-propeller protein
VAVGFGTVWVANHGDNSVSRIDPDTNRVVATVPVGEGPARIVMGFASAWVAHDREDGLWRIDPQSNRTLAIRVGGRTSGTPAVGLGGVWATIWDDSSLVRIDPITGTVAARVPVPAGPLGVQIAGSSLWVASSHRGRGTLSLVDPGEGKVVRSIPFGVMPWFQGPAAEGDVLWVADAYQGQVRRLDVRTLAVRTVVRDAPLPVAHLADGALWVNASDGRILRVDPETGRVTATLTAGASPGGVAVGAGSVWVSGFTEGTLWRLDWPS